MAKKKKGKKKWSRALPFAGQRIISGVRTMHRRAACQHPQCAVLPGYKSEDSQPDNTELDDLVNQTAPELSRLCARGNEGCIFKEHSGCNCNGYCCKQCRDNPGHGKHCEAVVVDFIENVNAGTDPYQEPDVDVVKEIATIIEDSEREPTRVSAQ